jgi:ferredoxin/flavodoxin---NADP+ reductase
MGPLNATLTGRFDLTADIARFRVRPDAAPPAFEPGQYLAIGLEIEGRMIQRPYSTASARGTRDELEFLIRRVPDGTLTSRLWQLPTGARLRLGPPKGLLRLVPGNQVTHMFVATGTGLAPFVSMLRSSLPTMPALRAIVVHGVSYVPELGYRAQLERWQGLHPLLTYRPVISRPHDPANAGWRGPVGRLDSDLTAICDDMAIDPADTIAYLCGNPAMIAAVTAVLHARGLPQESVRTEQYWTAQAQR